MNMQLIETQQELRQMLAAHRELKRSIGLVPTMGALHAGHASLIKRAVAENAIVVVSDFVNPTQFNNPLDLKNYPRLLTQDAKLVEALGAHILFAPAEKEMYPTPDTRVFDLSPYDAVMEGSKRPGHFNGVAQIVSKLFELVKPHRAYFGEKDYQQLRIIERLVETQGFSIQIVPCPIVREESGLAMSSRNQLLDSDCRREAPKIYKALRDAADALAHGGVAAAQKEIEAQINATGVLQIEYVTFASAKTLEAVDTYTPGDTMAFVAVQANGVRLIDNYRY